MRKRARETHTRRVRWLATLALAALVAAAFATIHLLGGPDRPGAPRLLRGPETVAVEFLGALMRTPDDAERVRAAGHLAADEDPQALIDRMATRVALEYLHARASQDIGQRVQVAERRQPQPRQYAVVLTVSERVEGETPPVRRFQLGLQQREDGDWRVTAVSAVD